MKKQRKDTYASVWDALADTPEQAANLHARGTSCARSRS
jgi:predicted XRE-type DNA-binding protein